ncbi:MAG: PQQ-binding-like beta-propeller repeat protein [Candidatus Binatia bacterium]|nr:PQQ-binding-like beta-propeller repeat protein [Candidatus Binatia bacterium]
MRFAVLTFVFSWACNTPGETPRAKYGVQNGQWRSWAGDPESSRYSPLDQINAANFAGLEPAWEWTSPDVRWRAEGAKNRPKRGSFNPARSARILGFQATPLMVDGRLYGSTAIGQVFALDAGTGEEIWVHDPQSYRSAKSPMNFIFPKHRGLSYWKHGDDERIFMPTIDAYLLALDAKTGRPVESFGSGGRVDLLESLRRTGLHRGTDYFQSSPAAVVDDTVVVGGSVTDRPKTLPGLPGDIRGFDALSGRLKWVFHVVPEADEVGHETWENGSWKDGGGSNAWGAMSVDPALGYVYVATSSPTNDHYGGHRPGDNLFSDTLLCLDGENGERIWHQQLIRHDLWDYDLAAAPNLVDLQVDGRHVEAVALATKQGFTFVFDRKTGEPLWPIEDREVPRSHVPGEPAAATQRFPTKPPAFELQGSFEKDLMDFTPALRAKALDVFRRFRTGPLFTPPSRKGTLVVPGPPGGTSWQGAGFDPETRTLYVPSITHGQVVRIQKGKAAETTFDFATESVSTPWATGPGWTAGSLPLFKPPYSRITAVDLDRGETRWQVPNGNGPRNHPLLAHLDLPRLGSGAHACVLVTSKLLLSVDRAWSWMPSLGEPFLRAYDKSSGALLGEVELPATARGCPLTYLHDGKQYVVMSTGSDERDPSLLALTLPAGSGDQPAGATAPTAGE